MDQAVVEQLGQALELSLCSDNDKRRTAEKFIFDCMELAEFGSSMLLISTSLTYNEGRAIDVTQAAAIQFKNMAELHWKTPSEELRNKKISENQRVIIINQEDKEYVK